MTEFILTALTGDVSAFESAVSFNIAPRDRIKLAANVWFIEFDGKVQTLAERLGLENGTQGHYVLASIGSVNGFVPNDVVHWINQHDPNG